MREFRGSVIKYRERNGNLTFALAGRRTALAGRQVAVAGQRTAVGCDLEAGWRWVGDGTVLGRFEALEPVRCALHCFG